MKINIKYTIDPDKDILEQILENRGLSKEWMEGQEENLFDFSQAKNYTKGKNLLLHHINNNSDIAILVDSDQDGYASAAIIYQWILDKNNNINITPIVPEGKIHGIIESLVPDCDLLIIPDASSNENHKHKNVASRGIDILVLDHHEMEEESEYAVIINPKNSQCYYPNKNLSGAGVVWKFIRQIDLEQNSSDYEKYIDLAAIGIVGDVTSLISMENKAIVNMGIQEIMNPYFQAYLKADTRVRDKEVNPTLISFYMAPIVNSLIRMGDQEQKESLFQAMVGEIPAEPIIAELIRIKGRQDRKKDTIIPRIVMQLQKEDKEKYNIIFAKSPFNLPKSMTGLVAGQLASLYERPAILGRIEDDKFVGSLRSLNNSTVENFKDFCEESGLFDWVRGHQSAAGLKIPVENIQPFLNYAQEKLPPVEKLIECDFQLTGDKAKIIKAAVQFDNHIGCDVSPLYLYDEIDIIPSQVQMIGKHKNVFKIDADGITYIQFRFKGELPEKPCTLRIVGEPNLNYWSGTVTPQIFIKEMEYVDFAL